MPSRGNEEFEQALRDNVVRLHALARRLTVSSHDAEDLLQDTYALAWRAWRSSGPPDRVGPWLTTICLNQARSRWRRSTPTPLDPHDVAVVLDSAAAVRVINDTPEVEADVMARLDVCVVRRCMSQLPYAQREALLLMDLLGYTAAEAAIVLSVPRNTVLSRAHRGRQALAVLLFASEVRS